MAALGCAGLDFRSPSRLRKGASLVCTCMGAATGAEMGESDGARLGETLGLLDLARRGDTSSHEGLLEHLRPRIVLWCASRLTRDLRNHVSPEDVAQDVLLALHRNLASFRGEDLSTFHAWLFRIAENRIRDLADHHGALKRRPVRVLQISETTPATATVRMESLLRVRAAVERLSEDHRQVIQLRQLEEREVADVARMMERSENAVRVLHCRALKALRALMTEKV